MDGDVTGREPLRDGGSDRIWHAVEADRTLADLGVTLAGLSDAEAAARLARHGANRLPEAARRSALARFAAQFNNVLILVLLAAAAITAAIGRPVDAAVIAGVIVINAIIGFIQEGKAQRALDAVRAMLAEHATVVRAGERHTVAAETLVPGDIVLLAPGDRVPADLRLLRAKNLRLDEAALTGESVPAEKSVEPVSAGAGLGDRACMAHAGTVVAFGQATGVVTATATGTEIGRIGQMVSAVAEHATPLTRKLDQFARRITVFVLVVSVITVVYGHEIAGMPFVEVFMAVVGLAVAAIPEGLPAILTITLAIGTSRMAARNAIVRRLPAVETLGAVTVICTDKTGTLTRNEMTVVSVVTASGAVSVSGVGYAPEGGFGGAAAAIVDPPPHLLELARAGLLCNDAALTQGADGRWCLVGDPTEGALLTLALKARLDAAGEAGALPRVDEIPFDAAYAYMATLHHDHAGHARVYLKGAPERVLELCSGQAGGHPLDRVYWSAALEAAARRGERVLALARLDVPPGTRALAFDDITQRFELLGLACMIDPPRAEAQAAVAACRAAGVGVKMITGDHATTAAAIGTRLGLGGERPLTGAEADLLDDEALRGRILATDVVARASPENKLRLVHALRGAGHIVAMTGDGVNDAPALKAADIGVAMGIKGTDAAKAAAEMVLADDNFATIEKAVREGRTILDNIKKALAFVLPTNGGQAGVILLAVFAGLALPVMPVQILWVNMVTTVTLALALAFEPPEAGVMSRPPRPPAEPLITRALAVRILYTSVLLVAATFLVFRWELARGETLEAARTAAVNVLVFGQIAYVLNCRHFTACPRTLAEWTANRVVLAACATLVLLQAAFTYAPPMQFLFGTAAIDAVSWAWILALSFVLWIAVEAEKLVLRRLGVARL
jgi:magnesium-transporting ATPase (P-type)